MTEFRRAEVRAAPGRRLVGAPVRYGATARVRHPSGIEVTESVAAFAFSGYLASGRPTTLNLDHDRSITIGSTAPSDRGRLELRESPAELLMTATMPTGDVFDDVLKLVADGDAAELSVEMRVQDELLNGDRRIVRTADLPGIGIVHAGAYRGQVEVRQEGRGVAGRIPYNRNRTISNRGSVRKERFAPGAFNYNLQRFAELQEELNQAISRGIEEGARQAIQDRLDEVPDVILTAGTRLDGAVASMKARSVTFADTPEALEFVAEDVTGVAAGRDLLEKLRAGTLNMGAVALYSLPPPEAVPDAMSIVPEEGNPDVQVQVISEALLWGVGITARAPAGNPGSVEVRGNDLVDQDDPGPRPWRPLLWL